MLVVLAPSIEIMAAQNESFITCNLYQNREYLNTGYVDAKDIGKQE